MTSTFADIKAQARRMVHSAMAVPCFYTANSASSPVALTARLHTKMRIGGDLAGGGYANIIEGVTRVVFNREELISAGVTLRKRGRVRFPDYNVSVELDARDPYDGAVTEKWTVGPA